MKTKLALFFLFIALMNNAQLATNVTITNLQGRVYSNITIDHTNALGVVWTTEDGSMGQIKYTELAMEYWERLSLSENAKNVQAAAALKLEELQQAELARNEAIRLQAEQQRLLAADASKKIQDLLTATNSEEQKIDAVVDTNTVMSADEKVASDSLLKALLDIQSSTTFGVSRNNFSELLAKATSALEFAKTKITAEGRHKYILCAEKAIDFYSKANDEWSDYFKYDWERERDKTLMSLSDLYNLRVNGLTVDISGFQKDENGNDSYYVPFNDCLTMYWNAADIYVLKMKVDMQK